VTRTTPWRTPDLPGREQRQFVLLFRQGRRRLLQGLAFSHESDPLQFLIWGLALVLIPVLGNAAVRPLRYGMTAAAGITPEAVDVLLMRDRLFFLMYGMLVAALLASLLWDALFPDRQDQEIVGVLPVRPRTLAGARLAASLATALTVAGALTVPVAVLYGVAQGMLPGTPSMLRLGMAHLVAALSAFMFVFLSLMTLRGVVAIVAGERIAARVAVALQLLTVVAFVESFLFLPGVMRSINRQMLAGIDGVPANPLAWFGGLYWWLAGGGPQWSTLALTAGLLTALAALLVAGLSLGPARRMGRRVLETSTRERAGGYMVAARAVARLSASAPQVSGMFLFAIASLMRSRRHALILATYLGLAIAIGAVGLISAGYANRFTLDEPTPYMLAVPMILLFFLVFGLKAAIAIPTDVDANWPFRLTRPTARQTAATARRLLMTLAVTPVVVGWAAVAITLWGAATGLLDALFVFVSGLALVEFAVGGWTKVPFASAHEPAASTLKSKIFFYIFFLHVFCFILTVGQLSGLRSPGVALRYVGCFIAATIILRLKHERDLRRREVALDAEEDGTVVLNLSEASS
jgi:hypothetical protein